MSENGLAAVPTLELYVVGGYGRDEPHIWVWVSTAVARAVVRRPTDAQGFVVLPKRWMVERTLAWLSRYRRLAKDFERLIENSTAYLYSASVHVMARRPAPLRATRRALASATLVAQAAYYLNSLSRERRPPS